MERITLKINGSSHELEVPADMPLLWVLRERLNLPGTKYGCGIGICGTCTVLLDGEPVRSCVLPATALEGSAGHQCQPTQDAHREQARC